VRLLAGSEFRRFRRSICRTCASTHVLVPKDTLLRRRDGVEVIGKALSARAGGKSLCWIASDLDRAVSTVRGWLGRFSAMAEVLRGHFTRWAHSIDPGHERRFSGGSVFADALDAIGVLGIVTVRRFGPYRVWWLASVVTGGRLLNNTSAQFPQPM
jgi:hypothetical protein